MPGCLDSGHLDAGRLDAWTLEVWAPRANLEGPHSHSNSIESIGSKVVIFRSLILA